VTVTGEISFSEFCKLMLPVFTGQFGDTELYYAFKKFDKSGNGYLSVSELKEILSKIGQNFTEAEVIEMMLSVGSDISKGLDFEGFFLFNCYNLI
jgi:Ca2+-binding EF-hand superfamily protein